MSAKHCFCKKKTGHSVAIQTVVIGVLVWHKGIFVLNVTSLGTKCDTSKVSDVFLIPSIRNFEFQTVDIHHFDYFIFLIIYYFFL